MDGNLEDDSEELEVSKNGDSLVSEGNLGLAPLMEGQVGRQLKLRGIHWESHLEHMLGLIYYNPMEANMGLQMSRLASKHYQSQWGNDAEEIQAPLMAAQEGVVMEKLIDPDWEKHWVHQECHLDHKLDLSYGPQTACYMGKLMISLRLQH